MTRRSAVTGIGPHALVALIATSVVLLGILIWQSVRATRDHLAAAEAVLTDYSRLAAETYERRLKGLVGYQVIYQTGQALQLAASRTAVIEDVRAGWLAGSESAAILRAIHAIAELDRSGGPARFLYGEPDAPLIEAMLDRGEVASDGEGFGVTHWEVADVARTSVLFAPDAEGTELVLDLDPSALPYWFERAFDESLLLPSSIAPDNRSVHLRALDPTGRQLYASPAHGDPYLMIRHVISDDYGGLFAGHVLETSIDPAFAPELVIGGLPRTRLPLLILLLVLTVGVLGATFWVLLRDRSLAHLREAFVAEVSHELRTPLSQIRLFAETLSLGRVDSADQRRKYLGIINREARRLGHLVDNILAFSSHRTGTELAAEQTPLGPLLEDIVASYEPVAAGRGDQVVFDATDGALAVVDREALRQVMLNLLDNASKYGAPGQVIHARLEQTPDSVEISVEDAGPGVPEAERERIWEPYHRLRRDRERAIAGAGIGLSVARDLVERMRGDCRVEAAASGGARFVIRLPLAVGHES